MKTSKLIGCDPMCFVRENVKRMQSYSSARDEYSGTRGVFLDANENPFDSGLNRYPDPQQKDLRQRLALLKGIASSQVFLGNGSDEVIDLLLRAFCQPGKDNVVICTPTYGMYRVTAELNDAGIREVALDKDFQPDVEGILAACDGHSRLLFLCSPNNPTGNLLNPDAIAQLLEEFPGLVVLDEAYIDFAPDSSHLNWLEKYRNLFIVQTLSKAWGLAGIRLGMGFAQKEVIQVLDKIKPPYNVNVLTQKMARKVLDEEKLKEKRVQFLVEERERLKVDLDRFSTVKRIFPSDANFLLLKVDEPQTLYQFLAEQGIVVRDRSSVKELEGCIRISIGTRDENEKLLKAIACYDQK